MFDTALSAFKCAGQHAREFFEFTVVVRLVIISHFNQRVIMPEIILYQFICKSMEPDNFTEFLGR